jgi:predicted NBD/HSP70 family sugar kinase
MNWLGADLGGTWLRMQDAEPIGVQGMTPETLMHTLADQAHRLGCRGVAISFAGWLQSGGQGVDAGPNLGWGPVDLGALARKHGVLCHLENDVDSRAWGEWINLDQAEQARGDLLVINAGTGFALGLVVGGRLRRGVHGRAGEVGHLRPGLDGRCGCGALGCVETVLGGAHHEPESFDVDHVRASWVDAATRVLAPVVCALDPAVVVATGGILDHRPDVCAQLESSLIAMLPEAWWGDLCLRPSAQGDVAARRGVVDLARRHHDAGVAP